MKFLIYFLITFFTNSKLDSDFIEKEFPNCEFLTFVNHFIDLYNNDLFKNY